MVQKFKTPPAAVALAEYAHRNQLDKALRILNPTAFNDL